VQSYSRLRLLLSDCVRFSVVQPAMPHGVVDGVAITMPASHNSALWCAQCQHDCLEWPQGVHEGQLVSPVHIYVATE
jgi:hypothetical protein